MIFLVLPLCLLRSFLFASLDLAGFVFLVQMLFQNSYVLAVCFDTGVQKISYERYKSNEEIDEDPDQHVHDDAAG